MPVIINDLEVLVEPSPQPEEEAAVSVARPEPVTPQDLTDIIRRRAERLARLLAH